MSSHRGAVTRRWLGASLCLGLALATTGCMFEVWGGAYSVRQQGNSSLGYSLGASSGVYLDPTKARVRVAFSDMVDKTYHDKGQARSLKQTGWSEVRADYTYSRQHDYKGDKASRISLAVGWARQSGVVTLASPAARETTASAKLFFLGYTREAVLAPGKAWEDSASYSIGPAVLEWSSPAAGKVTAIGVQGRLTLALSPLGVVAFSAGLLSGAASAPGSNPGGTPANTTTTTTTTPTYSEPPRSNAGCYYSDECDVDGNCRSSYKCP